MRILVDCFKLIKGKGKSIGIYNVAVSVVKCISETIDGDDCYSDVEIIVAANKFNASEFENIPSVKVYLVEGYNPEKKIDAVLWELFGVAVFAQKLSVDKVLFPRGYVPFVPKKKYVPIVHDLIPYWYDEHFKGYLGGIENRYIKMRLKASVIQSELVITISEASKSDIVNRFGVSSDKIKVIYNEIPFTERSVERLDNSFLNSSGLAQGNYILAMATDYPHKNLEGILKSYSEYVKRVDNPYELVIIGVDDSSVEKLIDAEDLLSLIHCFRYIEDKGDYKTLFACAKAFIFLSLIEGFGLPPLEAMSYGVPVICSNTSSLPEVVGDAAYLVDPTNYVAISEAIVQMTSDERLRDACIEKGFENIKRFDLRSRAEEYRKVLFRQ